MVEVDALAASAASSLVVLITSALTPTRSAASAGARSYLPSAQRYSTERLGPSTKPASASPFRHAFKYLMAMSGAPVLRKPTTGVAGCCAQTAYGFASAP